MKHPTLKGMMMIFAFSTLLYAEPANLVYDLEPCPIEGFDYLSQQVEYPESLTWCNWEATVKLSFRIDPNGEISGIRVEQSGGIAFDRAAIDGINAVNWLPASVDGQAVPVRFELPFYFSRN